MSELLGFRPFQWDCKIDGCFNMKKRLNFANFYGCLPNRLSFTDLDAACERHRHFLFMDGKGDSQLNDLKTGQRLFFERLTECCPNSTAIVFAGNNEPLVVQAIRVCKRGRFSEWTPCTLEELKEKIRLWGITAEAAR